MSWRKLMARARRQGSAMPVEPITPSTDEPESHTCDSDSLQSAAEIISDNQDMVVLRLLREIFIGFCNGRVDHWQFACDQANEAMGEVGGVFLFAHVLDFARSIKSDRIGSFFFRSPGCSSITDDEMLAIQIVQAGRRNNLFELACLADAMAQGGALLQIQKTAHYLGHFVEITMPMNAHVTDNPAADRPRSTLH